MTDDDVKGDLMQRSREWLQSCVNAATRSGVPEEADLEAFILAHLDGEEARQAAAVAAAREEQREADAKFCPNCLGVGFVERPVPCPYCDDSTHDHYCPTGTQRQQCGCGAERIRATPLTATPLADRIAELEASNDAQWEETAHLAGARAKKVEAERDHWKGRWELDSSGFKGVIAEKMDRIAELATERDSWKAKAIRDPSQLAETLWSECYADLAAANVQNIAERDAVRTLVAERDALRAENEELKGWNDERLKEREEAYAALLKAEAQVEAARAGLERIANGYDDGVVPTLWNGREAQGHAQDTLAAMDGAKPK